MPIYHLNITLELGGHEQSGKPGTLVQLQQVVECETSAPAMVEVTIARMVQEGEITANDSRKYTGNLHKKLDLVLGEVPAYTEPITDRRGAIRDQKARNG